MLLNHSILFARAGFSDEKRTANLLPVPTQKGEPMKHAKQEDNASHVNRNYKDTLFRALFAEKKHLLSLYNAVNGTDYTNEDDLEVNTLDNVIYMKMKNDISFLFGFSLNLWNRRDLISRLLMSYIWTSHSFFCHFITSVSVLREDILNQISCILVCLYA